MDNIRFSQGYQSHEAVRIFRHMHLTLRYTVKRDAYDGQSYGKIERWDGEQWHLVERMPISAMPEATRQVRYVEPPERATSGLLAGLDHLHNFAVEFFPILSDAPFAGRPASRNQKVDEVAVLRALLVGLCVAIEEDGATPVLFDAVAGVRADLAALDQKLAEGK